ncbi:MAG: NADH-quinone oxidoreductase subunit L, partial [Xanthobacteraceae bacterium]
MYQAIVLLPLLGAVIAGIVCLVGARNRFPGEDPPPPADDDGAALVPLGEHAAFANSHAAAPEHVPSAAGSLLAELTTSTFLVISCVLSWFALFDVGIAGHEARVTMFSFISFADLHS